MVRNKIPLLIMSALVVLSVTAVAVSVTSSATATRPLHLVTLRANALGSNWTFLGASHYRQKLTFRRELGSNSGRFCGSALVNVTGFEQRTQIALNRHHTGAVFVVEMRFRTGYLNDLFAQYLSSQASCQELARHQEAAACAGKRRCTAPQFSVAPSLGLTDELAGWHVQTAGMNHFYHFNDVYFFGSGRHLVFVETVFDHRTTSVAPLFHDIVDILLREGR